LRYLYEQHPDFSAFPTYSVLPGLVLSMTSGLVSSKLKDFDLTQVLHGEQYVEVLKPIPTECELTTRGTVIDVMDKKSGALVVTLCESFDKNGTLLIRNQSATFVVGAGNFGGKNTPNSQVIPTVPAPNRSPDYVVLAKTSPDQAALYRLSGDYNPMHIDPNFGMCKT
jgi:(3R)-3-hydroxyacyl-CoA dehydrogenase / 3a,7a,12a-trihydroxy-5b-cholest-24-enoyl-CoA hydratase / enoyl-CoA hydratase 2